MSKHNSPDPPLNKAPPFMNNPIFSSIHRSSTHRKIVKDSLYMKKSTKALLIEEQERKLLAQQEIEKKIQGLSVNTSKI